MTEFITSRPLYRNVTESPTGRRKMIISGNTGLHKTMKRTESGNYMHE